MERGSRPRTSTDHPVCGPCRRGPRSEFARSEGLELAVRGGAHSIAGFWTSNGGWSSTLSPMKGMGSTRSLAVPVAAQAQPFGPSSASKTPGRVRARGDAAAWGCRARGSRISHFSAAGSGGWLREFGMTCDNLLSADLVTADGRLVNADERRAWARSCVGAARRRRQNSVLVTSMEFPASGRPDRLRRPDLLRRGGRRTSVRGSRDLAATLPNRSPRWRDILMHRPVPFLPEEPCHGQPIVAIIRVYTRFRTPGPSIRSPPGGAAGRPDRSPCPTPGPSRSLRNYFTGALLTELSDEGVDTLLTPKRGAGTAPVHTSAPWQQHHGQRHQRDRLRAPRRGLRPQHHCPVPPTGQASPSTSTGRGNTPGRGPVDHGPVGT